MNRSKTLLGVFGILLLTHNVYSRGKIDDVLEHPRFKRSVSAIKAIFSADSGVSFTIPGNSRPDLCASCENTAGLILAVVQVSSDEDLQDTIHGICLSYQVMPPEVCEGMTRIFTPELAYIMRNRNISAKKFCGFALQRYNCPEESDSPDWNITFAGGTKPELQEHKIPKPNAPKFKILHLTDLHYQPEYMENANTECGTYLCCRDDQGISSNVSNRAGKWGDYRNCDMPYRSLDNMMEHITKQHKDLDMVLMTGDLPPHALWATSRESNLDIITNMTNLIKKYFPNTPVYPVLGNHEAHPANCFPPITVHNSSMNPSYLYNKVAELWEPWLTKDALETVKNGGYYSIVAKPGLRIITLNNNVAYSFNWWILYDADYPKQQLQWLASELLAAEKFNEKVYILGHIPPGSDSVWKLWDREFHKIVNRFEDTIIAQFYGHLHTDEFRLFYDIDNPKRPTSVAFVGGSATTYSYLNPNYKIFLVDGNHNDSTWRILDHESWIYNLSIANSPNNSPHWYKLYSAKQDLRLPAFLPADMEGLVLNMLKDRTLLDKYHRYYVKDSDYLLTKECDIVCKRSLLCNMVVADVNNLVQCNALVQEIDRIESLGGLDTYVHEQPTNDIFPPEWDHDLQHEPAKPSNSQANSLVFSSSLSIIILLTVLSLFCIVV